MVQPNRGRQRRKAVRHPITPILFLLME